MYGEALLARNDEDLDDYGLASANSAGAMSYHLNRALDAALVVDQLRVIGEYTDRLEDETPFQAIEAAVARARAESAEEQG